MTREEEKELVKAIHIIAHEAFYGISPKSSQSELNEISNLLRCIIFLCSRILQDEGGE